jgi:hypothetical protein
MSLIEERGKERERERERFRFFCGGGMWLLVWRVNLNGMSNSL